MKAKRTVGLLLALAMVGASCTAESPSQGGSGGMAAAGGTGTGGVLPASGGTVSTGGAAATGGTSTGGKGTGGNATGGTSTGGKATGGTNTGGTGNTTGSYQTVTGLANGYYSLTASFTKSGVGNCYISAKDYGGGPEMMTSLPVSSQATTIIVRGINVTNGQATIGLTHDAAGNGCTATNLKLTQDGIQYKFLKGGDATEVTRTEKSGAKYSDNGVQADPFVILKNRGYNIVRLRLYNDPGNASYSPSNQMPPYANPSDILNLSKRAKAQGLMIELTFHYSDYWTNAATQYPPHEWSSITNIADLKTAMYDFTYSFLTQMAAQGTTPEYVSIGNESNGGLPFPFGCAYAYSGAAPACTSNNWSNLGQLYATGYQAVKDVSSSTQVIIHLAYDNGASPATAASAFNSYFNSVTSNGGNYDIKGLSYYPFWSKATVADFVSMANSATTGSSKPLLIMETGYNWNPTRQDGTAGQLTDNGPEPYPSTPQGQKDFLLDLFAGIKLVNSGKCLGDLYWDPVNIIKNSQVSNTAMFDFDGKALIALDAYQYND
jgi:arabinogalactan endo-1,4-beta-galactosidase